MQKSNLDWTMKRACCSGKVKQPKKPTKKASACKKNKSTGSRHNISLDNQEFSETFAGLAKHMQKLAKLSRGKPSNHTYRLSASKQPSQSNQQSQILKLKDPTHQQIQALRRSQSNLIQLNESLSQQLSRLQTESASQSQKALQVQRALEEELRVLRARLEAEGRLEGELERVREELRRESAKKGDLEREVRELRERMQEMGRELERRGWEISQAANKTAEEYSGKYVKEISELEESHRAALKRLSNQHSLQLQKTVSNHQHKLSLLSKQSSLLQTTHTSQLQTLTTKLTTLTSQLTQKDLTSKLLQRKHQQHQTQLQTLRKRLQSANQDRVQARLQLQQLQTLVQKLTKKQEVIEEQKQDYYATVVECRKRIEELERELEGRMDEEDYFMGRLEVLAGKVTQLEQHKDLDKQIRRSLEDRIVQLEETNRVLKKFAEEGGERNQVRLLDENVEEGYKEQVMEYRVKWEQSQKMLRRLQAEMKEEQLTGTRTSSPQKRRPSAGAPLTSYNY